MWYEHIIVDVTLNIKHQKRHSKSSNYQVYFVIFLFFQIKCPDSAHLNAFRIIQQLVWFTFIPTTTGEANQKRALEHHLNAAITQLRLRKNQRAIHTVSSWASTQRSNYAAAPSEIETNIRNWLLFWVGLCRTCFKQKGSFYHDQLDVSAIILTACTE